MVYPPAMKRFRRVAVYCGSSNAVDERFKAAARSLGTLLAERGLGLVYGAGNVGLMGQLADAALAGGAEVIGVIPHKLAALEVAHDGLSELITVDSMHARKTVMCSLSDAFVVLPGGYGTLDEMFEAITWTQLGYHQKPVGLLDVDGYFDHLVAFLDHATASGFVRTMHREILVSEQTPEALLDRLATMDLPHFTKWIERT